MPRTLEPFTCSAIRSRVDAGEKPPAVRSPEWEALCDEIERELGRKICRAKRKSPRENPGWPCTGPHVGGRPRCKHHGGCAPKSGPLHHSIRHGRYSKALAGKSIADAYSIALADPTLMQLNDEIALLVARQQQLLERLGTGDSRTVWDTALTRLDMLERAVREGRHVADRLAALRAVFESGAQDYALWSEYNVNVEQLRKLVETSLKYRDDSGLMVTPERLTLLLMQLNDAIREVLDKETAGKLRTKLEEIRRVGDRNLHLVS